MKKLYCVKSQRLASYLMQKGFRLIRMDVDRNNPKFNIFLFNISDDLLKEITIFTNEINRKN